MLIAVGIKTGGVVSKLMKKKRNEIREIVKKKYKKSEISVKNK